MEPRSTSLSTVSFGSSYFEEFYTNKGIEISGA